MAIILGGVAGLALVVMGLGFALLAWRLARSSGAAYRVAHSLTRSTACAFAGRLYRSAGEPRDHHIVAGLSLDADKRWQVEGRLSDEAVRAVIGK